VGAPPLTLGTAGHIDHGKTALVAALTGVDTDRLPQERARGISIELGYAPLDLPSGRRVSIVDVPGHERFVRTMVAGATGIDLFLLTVAADDGVMPQTREHVAVLTALGVTAGVVAVTKTDLADPTAAAAAVAGLLPDVEVVPVSARTGQGVEDLRRALDAAAAGLPGRAAQPGPACLHVDRAFTVHGVGTVVTGTLWSGSIGRGDELAVLPAGRRARVRGVEVHDEPRERAGAGQRVAVNLAGIGLDEIARGDVLAGRDSGLRATHLVDAALEFAEARPEHGARVMVHHGTREVPARLAELGGRFWQLRLERPLVPARGDRLVVRSIAPPDTLGGGTVLDPAPRKHGASREATARLTRLARGESEPEPASPPVAEPTAAPPPPPLTPAALDLEARLREAGTEPPIDSTLGAADAEHLAALRAHGRIVRVGRQLHYHRDALAEVERRVRALVERDGSVTLAGLRDELGTSRKFAQALLEHFDAARVTRRLPNDERVLRSR
jgi:selenocysteine-specific elongation factor